MATKNPRLNVVLEPILYEGINKLADRQGMSMSLVARDLIKEALELHEDIQWNKIAEKRDGTYSKKKAKIHKEIWG